MLKFWKWARLERKRMMQSPPAAKFMIIPERLAGSGLCHFVPNEQASVFDLSLKDDMQYAMQI